jgi:hypothetical protein
MRLLLDAQKRARRSRGLVFESLEDRLVFSTANPLSPSVWTSLGPAPITNGQTPGNNPVSGQVNGIATDPANPSIIYVATGGGGVWKTTSGGGNWLPLTDTQATLVMGSIAVAPTRPSLVYAGTGDAGDGPNAEAGQGLLVSSNGGTTWTLQTDNGVFSGQSITKVLVSPANPDTVYVVVNGGGQNGYLAASATATITSGAVSSVTITNPGSGYTVAPQVTVSGGAGASATAVLNPSGGIGSIIINNGGAGYTAASKISIAPPPGLATGIYESNDGGATWINTTAGSISTTDTYSDLVMDPANPLILYAAVGTPAGSVNNGVYVTNDGGATWARSGNFLSAVGASIGQITLAISGAAVSPPAIFASIASPTNGSNLGIERSTDGGLTWSERWYLGNFGIGGSPPNYTNAEFGQTSFLALDPNNPDKLYAGGSYASISGTGGFQDTVVEIAPAYNSPPTYYDISVGADGNGPHIDQRTYAFDDSGDLLVGNDGGIWRLTNNSPTSIQWTDLTGNLAISAINGIALVPGSINLAYAGVAGNGTDEFNDSTAWTQLLGGDGGQVALDPASSSTIFSAGEFNNASPVNSSFFSVSPNGGRTWSAQTSGIGTATDNAVAYPPLAVEPPDASLGTPTELLVGTDHVYESFDNGASWQPISQPASPQGIPFSGWTSTAAITALAIAPSDPSMIYAATADGQVLVTDKATMSNAANYKIVWHQINVTVGGNLIGGPETGFWIDPNQPNTVYTVRAAFDSGTSVGHVFKSTDGGQTWQNISGNLPDVPTWSIVVDTRPGSARIYVGTDDGVYASSDGGATWNPYESGLPHARVTALELDTTTNILAAGTQGRGLFEISVQSPLGIQVTVTPPANATAAALLGDVAVAQFTDLGTPGLRASDYTATINWGNGNLTENVIPTPVPGGGFLVAGTNTYATAGTYVITVVVQNINGISGQDSAEITVADDSLSSPASFTISTTEGQIFEGQVTTFQYGNPTAPASDFTAAITWGNNSTSTGQVVADSAGNGLFDVDGTNFYNEYGQYPVTVAITDRAGTTITASGTAAVNDAQLSSTPQTVAGVAGTSFTGQVASFSDGNPVGASTDFSATINWGDGTATTPGTITSRDGSYIVSGSHLYTEAATYPVTVTIDDAGGASTTTNPPSTARISDASLIATPTSVTAAIGQLLASTTVIASFTTGNTLAQASDFSATSVNWGDGTAPTGATIVSEGAGQFSVEASHTYGNSGTFKIAVNIVSSGGSKVTTDSNALVSDIPVVPLAVTVTPPGSDTVVAGSALNNVLVATFAAPYIANPGYYKATIDWGDATGSTSGTISLDPLVQGQYDVYGSHTYTQAGSFTVAVDIQDGGGGTAAVASSAQVVAAPLLIQPVNISPVVVGNTFTAAVASFTDPNPFDTARDFVSSIDWGNGTVNAGQIVAVPGGFNVVGTNAYSQLSGPAQPYTITITIYNENAPDPFVVTNNVQVDSASITPAGQTLSAVEGAPFYAVVASFVDGNPLAPAASFSASITWGNGNTSPGIINAQGNGHFTVSGTNTYDYPGKDPISVSIDDIGGATAIASSMAVVAGAALAPAASSTEFTAFQGNAFSGAVAAFNDANPDAPAGDFTATINWGNGTVNPGTILELGGGLFQVTGSNTYSSAGSFPVVVTVTGIDVSNLVLNTTALVVTPLQGSTGNGGYTNIAEPTFSGTGQPGAAIGIFVTPASGSTPAATGRALVNASGRWSVQVGPALTDGSYGVTATMTSSVNVAPLTVSLGTVQIDSQGPTVAAISLVPAARQLRVTFQDNAGLNPASLANAGNYVLGARVNGQLRNFGVVGLQTVAGPASNQVTEIVTYDLGKRPPTGTYVVTLNALGLTDRAGNILVETHFVTFPQTTNSPNPDYVAQFNVTKHLAVTGPIVYVPATERRAASGFVGLLTGRRVRNL